MRHPVLLCGATGRVGAHLRAALDAAGTRWIGLSRRPPAGEPGEWRQADFERPDTLAPLLDGVDTVFLACGDHPRQELLEGAVLAACRQRRVPRVVKLSAQSAGLTPPVSFGVAHARVERELQASGAEWTLLRPVFFMQSLLLLADAIARGTLIAATGAGRVAFVDVRDVAALAAAVLTRPDQHAGAIYTLTGPRAFSFAELADLISRRCGHRVRHVCPPRWFARLVLPWASGMPRWRSDRVVALMAAIAAGAQETPTDDVLRVTGDPPRALEDFVEEQRGAFGAR